jgi:hypothetical protein
VGLPIEGDFELAGKLASESEVGFLKSPLSAVERLEERYSEVHAGARIRTGGKH